MNIITRICDYFTGKPAAPALRNKPGGMAYLNARCNEGSGTGALVGRIVQTVSFDAASQYWRIDPPQPYTVTADTHFKSGFVAAGTNTFCIGVSDVGLTPLADPGHEEQDESLRYLPPVPRTERAKERV